LSPLDIGQDGLQVSHRSLGREAFLLHIDPHLLLDEAEEFHDGEGIQAQVQSQVALGADLLPGNLSGPGHQVA
jgi:hypothetical protein